MDEIYIRTGDWDWYKEKLDLCDHIQLPKVSFRWNNPEYTQTVPIRCKVCDKTFTVNIGVN